MQFKEKERCLGWWAQEVEVIFDDIEEDAMVGPLMADDQLIMEHGGDEDGSTEVRPTCQNPCYFHDAVLFTLVKTITIFCTCSRDMQTLHRKT